MKDLSQLLIGIVLMIGGVGSLVACVPRRGKPAWFVGNSILESGISVLMIFTFAMGLLLLLAYFTTIDDTTLAGVAAHS